MSIVNNILLLLLLQKHSTRLVQRGRRFISKNQALRQRKNVQSIINLCTSDHDIYFIFRNRKRTALFALNKSNVINKFKVPPNISLDKKIGTNRMLYFVWYFIKFIYFSLHKIITIADSNSINFEGHHRFQKLNKITKTSTIGSLKDEHMQ